MINQEDNRWIFRNMNQVGESVQIAKVASDFDSPFDLVQIQLNFLECNFSSKNVYALERNSNWPNNLNNFKTFTFSTKTINDI